jgi:predicted transposase/invertase (TIGR01784 family)
MDDGAIRIFLNTKGTNKDDVPAELVEFLNYVDSKPDTITKFKSSKVAAIDRYVHKIKASHEMGVKYMDRLYEEMMMKEKAMKEGHEQGLEQGLASTVQMLQSMGQSKEEIVQNLLKYYTLSLEKAERATADYWQS